MNKTFNSAQDSKLSRNISRRSLLMGAGGLALGACGGSGSAQTGQPIATPPAATPQPTPTPAPTPTPTGTSPQSLDELARLSGRRFGSVIRWSGSQTNSGSIQNPQYTQLVDAECGLIVPENEMKWTVLRPDRDTFAYDRFDDIVSWAQSAGHDIRGHTLLWHRPEWFPDWLNNYDYGTNPVLEAERLLTEHIEAVMTRYPMIQSHDVVNEAIDHSRNAPIETSLSRAMGSPEAVLDLAFNTARGLGPDKELVYNDYMSWEPGNGAHRNDVLRLLEGFRNRGTPVDTLGIQSHIGINSVDPSTGIGPYEEAEWRAFLDEVVGMGYKLMITEFDVKDKALTADTARRDAAVAEYARRYFELMLEYDELTDILGWGMVDQFSWLQSFAPRDDGLEVRGCPYDSTYHAKPLREAIATALMQASTS